MMPFIKQDYSSLPSPDEAAEAHARAMMDSLRDLIGAHGGLIGFDQYMQHVLYAPGLGYYAAGAAKLGAYGDYVTAPMISGLFSQTLARFCVPYLEGRGSILELGAGTGIMAADILKELAQLNRLPDQYLILEVSADLRQRQQQTLQGLVPELAGLVRWLERLDPNDGFQGIILGNEVIDALPVKRFVVRDGQIHELGVGWQDNVPCWRERVAGPEFMQRVGVSLPSPIDEYPDGYCSEIRECLDGWMDRLSGYLQQGVMLFLDYGMDRRSYYSSQRVMGTLRGYYRHRAIDDPFFRPGLADVTAWVDFTALAESAINHNLLVEGYSTQAAFLLDHGLAEIFEEKVRGDGSRLLSLSQQVKQLTLPGEMGDTVKAMMLSKHVETRAGMRQDLRYTL